MFSSSYYALVAGLREYTLDAETKGFDIKDILAEVEEALSASDMKVVDLLYTYYDCENLISRHNGSSTHNPLGRLSSEELEEELKSPSRLIAPLAKVIRLSLNRYKGTFSFYWKGDHKGQMTGQQLTGVSRFLYRTKKATVYQEISVAMILADGTGADIDEGNELTHLIVVFEKEHKLTDNEKKILKEYDIDYMFERK